MCESFQLVWLLRVHDATVTCRKLVCSFGVGQKAGNAGIFRIRISVIAQDMHSTTEGLAGVARYRLTCRVALDEFEVAAGDR